MKDKRLTAETLGCLHITGAAPKLVGDHSEHLLDLFLDKESQSRWLPFIGHITDTYRVGKVDGRGVVVWFLAVV